jgi:hypothetical protein
VVDQDLPSSHDGVSRRPLGGSSLPLIRMAT